MYEGGEVLATDAAREEAPHENTQKMDAQKTRNNILMLLALLVWGLIGIHYLALQFFLYWTLPWFDLLTHFWGGIFVGLLVLWLVYQSGYSFAKLSFAYPYAPRRALIVAFVAMLIIGALWEVYEYAARVYLHAPLEEGYFIDTSVDMVMDVLGVVFGWGIYYLAVK